MHAHEINVMLSQYCSSWAQLYCQHYGLLAFTFDMHGMLSVFIILLYNYTFNCYDTVPCHACICARWIREIGLNQIHYKILMPAPKTWWTLVEALAAKPLHIHGTQQRSSIHVQPCNVKHCIKKSLLNSIWFPLSVWLGHSGGLSQIPTAKTCSTPWTVKVLPHET